jgi:large subunit ribosomal protein L35
MANKNKTIKTIAKKFKVTKNGKVLRRKAGQNHLNAKENGKTTRQKRNDIILGENSAKTLKRVLTNS